MQYGQQSMYSSLPPLQRMMEMPAIEQRSQANTARATSEAPQEASAPPWMEDDSQLTGMKAVKLKCPGNEIQFDEDDIAVSVQVQLKIAARMDGKPPPDVSSMQIHVYAQFGPYAVVLKEETADYLIQIGGVDLTQVAEGAEEQEAAFTVVEIDKSGRELRSDRATDEAWRRRMAEREARKPRTARLFASPPVSMLTMTEAQVTRYLTGMEGTIATSLQSGVQVSFAQMKSKKLGVKLNRLICFITFKTVEEMMGADWASVKFLVDGEEHTTMRLSKGQS